MNTIKAITDIINNMSEAELVQLNNLYCESINNYDSIVYGNDEEFFELINFSGLRVAQATFYGNYNYSHDWVTFDGYGNFKSYAIFTTDCLIELVNVIAEYISDNQNDFSEFDEIIETLRLTEEG